MTTVTDMEALRLVWDEAFLAYDFGPAHPMAPIRLDLSARLMRDLGLLSHPDVAVVPATPASDADLHLVHDPAYVAAVRAASAPGARAEPGYADGWLNVARALIQEGETEAAKPFIAESLKCNPSLGRTFFFKAMIEKSDGDYPAALKSLEATLAQYPRDRVALNQVARILFLQREYRKTLDALARVDKIDPEDVQMHYTAMLAQRGLGNAEAASREQQLFMRFKAEESAQAITGERRRMNPEENNERQAIHEHESVPLSTLTAHHGGGAGSGPGGMAASRTGGEE